MPDLSTLKAALQAQLPDAIAEISLVRENELHFRIANYSVLALAGLLQNDFHASLIVMLANDRSAGRGIFEIHYLFANPAENWFVDACSELPADDPQIESMATFFLPAGRYEREIQDMFGIRCVGHPLTRRLVRHSFWPESYYPLRKDAVVPERLREELAPYPFLPVYMLWLASNGHA